MRAHGDHAGAAETRRLLGTCMLVLQRASKAGELWPGRVEAHHLQRQREGHRLERFVGVARLLLTCSRLPHLTFRLAASPAAEQVSLGDAAVEEKRAMGGVDDLEGEARLVAAGALRLLQRAPPD